MSVIEKIEILLETISNLISNDNRPLLRQFLRQHFNAENRAKIERYLQKLFERLISIQLPEPGNQGYMFKISKISKNKKRKSKLKKSLRAKK